MAYFFRFASLFGSILADLAITGKTKYDLTEFRFDRPAITDPNFKSQFHMTLEDNQKSKL